MDIRLLGRNRVGQRLVETNGVQATARELGIGFVAHSPLGRGIFAGAICRERDLATDDFRRKHPRFQGANLAQNLRLAAELRSIAADRGIAGAQLTLAWLLQRELDIVPIFGTLRADHVGGNAEAASIHLDRTDLARIDSAVPAERVAGDRYPDMSEVCV